MARDARLGGKDRVACVALSTGVLVLPAAHHFWGSGVVGLVLCMRDEEMVGSNCVTGSVGNGNVESCGG